MIGRIILFVLILILFSCKNDTAKPVNGTHLNDTVTADTNEVKQ